MASWGALLKCCICRHSVFAGGTCDTAEDRPLVPAMLQQPTRTKNTVLLLPAVNISQQRCRTLPSKKSCKDKR